MTYPKEAARVTGIERARWMRALRTEGMGGVSYHRFVLPQSVDLAPFSLLLPLSVKFLSRRLFANFAMIFIVFSF